MGHVAVDLRERIVELLGRYSRYSWHLDRLRKLLNLELPPSSLPARRRPRQHQTRLAHDAVGELVAMYQVGATIEELADRFKVNRTTVMGHLDRAGVETRYRRLTPEQVKEAARLYAEGWSLARLGERFYVSPSTVHKALRKMGIRMRDSHGRER